MIDPITQLGILVVNVGCNIYNNIKAKNIGTELQSKQQEFIKAQTDRQFDRMRQLQLETEQLQNELDDEVHRQRLEDIEREYDNLVTSLAFKETIHDWPLNSLPFVIKGESFGSFLGCKPSIAIHCIFAISNSKAFNENLYAELDQRIEQFCNLNYGPTSSHPIIYYGNGWRRNVEVTKGRVDQLCTNLNTLPTILIEPHFTADTGRLKFVVSIWGMGLSSSNATTISIYPREEDFSYGYTFDTDFSNDDIKLCSLEELPIYISTIYSYVADIYYNKYYHIPPVLPSVLNQLPEGKLWSRLYKDNYLKLSASYERKEEILLDPLNAVSTFRSLFIYYSKEEFSNKLDEMINILNEALRNNSISTEELPSIAHELELIAKEVDNEKLRTFITYCQSEIDRGFILDKISFEHINEISIEEQNVDSLDLAEFIERYENFISEYSHLLDINNLSLYFKLIDNNKIDIHIMENDSLKVLLCRKPFNFRVFYQNIKRRKQFNSIFKNRTSLYCKTGRIAHLKEMYNSDMLIF